MRNTGDRLQPWPSPEIIDDCITGFIVENEPQAVAAITKVHTVSRQGNRSRFEARFTARRMAKDYLDVYRALARQSAPKLRVVP